ncbi:MAG: hypothetical protein ACOYYS_00585 [Chloroflexota bacterium]
MNRERLLINWVYYHAIGHTIEALRYAHNWRTANPHLEIAIALNARAGVELAQCVPGVDCVYPVEVGEFETPNGQGKPLEQIPGEWDYYVVDPRHKHPMGWDALDHCEQAMRAHIQAGFVADDWDSWSRLPLHGVAVPLAFCLPLAARKFAKDFLATPHKTRITLLFGSGAEPSRTPALNFWRRLIGELIEAFGDVEIILLGASKAGQSITQGITAADVDGLLKEFPQARNGFDLGLLNQLALAECCQLHISPHTGMSFAIQCVGVPWLVISGGDVAENVVNGVPFASIYPDCAFYPCGPWFAPQKNPMLPECVARREKGEAFLCLSESALEPKFPQIHAAARALVNEAWPYFDCVQHHYRAMLPRLGKQDGEAFLDGWPSVLSQTFVFPGKK